MADGTAEKKLPAHKNPDLQFKPGVSPNPLGRPKGSRNKLGEAFIEALHDDFLVHGAGVIETVRVEDPVAYMKVVAGILPKEIKLTDERELSDDELIQRIRQLDAIIQPFLNPEGAEEAGGGGEAASRH